MRHNEAHQAVQCKNYTDTGVHTLSVISLAGVNHGIAPPYPPVASSILTWTASTTPFTPSSYTADQYYTMMDTKHIYCQKPITISPSLITYAYPAEFGSAKTVVLSLTLCDGRNP